VDATVIWGFFKNYVHTQARTKFRFIKNMDFSVDKKMDKMEWLAKNVEFISSKVVVELVATFRDMIDSALEAKNPILYARHNSLVIQTTLGMIRSHKYRGMVDPNGVSK
jgi:hypothetical protein